MTRPITLFTGQWADLPFEEVCRLAAGWGYEGLEIACWGDHFEVDKALSDDSYVPRKLELLEKYRLKVWTISCHLTGQAVCDHPIDERHQGILPARIWPPPRPWTGRGVGPPPREGGPGGPPPARIGGEGERGGGGRGAAEEIKDPARAAAKGGVDPGVGFPGPPIWHPGGLSPPVPP